MPIIDGIGDEILTALVAVLITLLLYVAWRTTGVPDLHSSYMLVRTQNSPLEVEVFSVQNSSAHVVSVDTSETLQQQQQQQQSGDVAQSHPTQTLNSAPDAGTGVPSEEPTDCPDDGGVKPGISDENLVVQLRFLDDSQRLVPANLSQRIGDFKRQHFASDLDEGKVVRLIYGGQLLRDDCRSLASYGLFDNCVVHCHISRAPYAAVVNGNAGTVQSDNQEHPSEHVRPSGQGMRFDIGSGVYAIFGVKFAFLWAVLYFFPDYFDTTSLVSLLFCSCISLCLFTGVGRRLTAENQTSTLNSANDSVDNSVS